MCKVFAMSNMQKVKITKKFVSSVRSAVTAGSDDHGFGYAVLGEDGAIGGERTLTPKHFSASLTSVDDREVAKLPFVSLTRNGFGTINLEAPKAFIGHGRYSTNHRTLENTHPYFNGEVALIHNGVVQDPDGTIDEKRLETTNDTELLLRMWEDGQMDAIEKSATGYYALAILDASGLLHIIRDDRAMLYISYCRTVDSFMFATTPEILKKVAKDMQWKIEEPEEVLENVHITLDRNEYSHVDISPRQRVAHVMTAVERESLGYNSGSRNTWSGGFGGFNPKGDSETGVFDASIGIEDDEPSYRENKRAVARAELEAEIVMGESERNLIDDGAPNVNASYLDEGTEMYESVGTDGYDVHRRS